MNDWDLPGVSYVMPVFNEGKYVREAIEGILTQEYDGEKEVLLALGPSTDETTEIVEAMAADDTRIRFVFNPAAKTPSGLNLAVKASQYPVVIRVDAHSLLAPDYTRRGVETLTRTGAADVGGRMDARGRNRTQRAVAAAYNSPFGLGGAAYHSGAPEGEAESAYLGIFRRSIFDEVGFFDETLWRGQDWELCLRIRKSGQRVWFDPQLSTTYFPRDEFRPLAAQSFASGAWRGELARRYPEGKSLRHLLPPAMLAGCALGTLAWTVPTRGLGNVTISLLRLARLAPTAYALLAVLAAARPSSLTPGERATMLRVLPTIHFPWAAGFIRGRLFGAGQTTDKSRVAGQTIISSQV